MMRLFIVVLEDGSRLEVQAEDFAVSDFGAVTFWTPDGETALALAHGAWRSVRVDRRPKAAV